MKITTLRRILAFVLALATIMGTVTVNTAKAATADTVTRIFVSSYNDKLVIREGQAINASFLSKLNIRLEGQTATGKIMALPLNCLERGEYVHSKNGKIKLTFSYKGCTTSISPKVSVKAKKLSVKTKASASTELKEGQVLSMETVNKLFSTTCTYADGKKVKFFKGYLCKQIGKTVKPNAKGKYGITLYLNKAKVTKFVPVNRMKRIYIRQCLYEQTEGEKFSESRFKEETKVMAQYTKGSAKALTTYTASVQYNSAKTAYTVTVKYRNFKDSITLKVLPAKANTTPQASATEEPTAVPSVVPTETATTVPSQEPSVAPTTKPSEVPSETPSEEPTEVPSDKPTTEPTEEPTAVPTEAPITKPTTEPTEEPTQVPTEAPTAKPTAEPTAEPTQAPTEAPTTKPTAEPTQAPTEAPTAEPTAEPTQAPTEAPTVTPTTEPTEEPTMVPTEAPTVTPTTEPTEEPTTIPTEAPKYNLNISVQGDGLVYLDDDEVTGMIEVEKGIYGLYAEATSDTKFIAWEDAEGNVLSNRASYIVDIDSDTTIVAHFVNVYKATVGRTAPVAVTADGSLLEFNSNIATRRLVTGDHTFTTSSNEDYKFLKWTDGEGNTLSTDSSITLNVTENVELIAVYESIYTVTVNKSVETGKVTVDGQVLTSEMTKKVVSGESVELVATNTAEWRFIRWADSLTNAELSTDKKFDLTVSSNMAVVAVFKRVYTVSITRVGSGTVLFNGKTLDFTDNSTVEEKVTTGSYKILSSDNDDWYFSKYIIDGVEFTNNLNEFSVVKNLQVTVNFAEKTKTVNVAYMSGENGQVYTSDSITKGETLTPPTKNVIKNGHVFTGWILGETLYSGTLGDEEFYDGNGNSLSDAVKSLTGAGENVVIYANFVAKVTTFTVTISGGNVIVDSAPVESGVVESGSTVVERGTKISVRANVPEGKSFVKWQDSEGNFVISSQNFTTTVNSNLSYVAIFADQPVEKEPIVYFNVVDGQKYASDGKNYTFFIACDIPDNGKYKKIEWGVVLASLLTNDDDLVVNSSKTSTNPDGQLETKSSLVATQELTIPFPDAWITEGRLVRAKVYAILETETGQLDAPICSDVIYIDLSQL